MFSPPTFGAIEYAADQIWPPRSNFADQVRNELELAVHPTFPGGSPWAFPSFTIFFFHFFSEIFSTKFLLNANSLPNNN